MKIVLADVCGFCFGVDRAVKTVEKALQSSKNVYTDAEIVHNKDVNEKLKEQGLVFCEDTSNLRDCVIIGRTHGTPLGEKRKIHSSNTYIDTVCPFVKKMCLAVKKYYEEGFHIIIWGKKGHPEIKCVSSFCDDECLITRDIDEILKSDFLKNEEKTFLVFQTTTLMSEYEAVIELLSGTVGLTIKNTICSASEDRQKACAEIAKHCEAIIVLGGKNSSNTINLKETAEQYCKDVFHIERIDELKRVNLNKYMSIGITAGASTPVRIIKEAVRTMESLNQNEMMEAIESTITHIRRGDIVEGEVLFVKDDEIQVNINYRSDGIISRDEISNDPDVKATDLYKVGDKINVYVIKLDDGNGNVVLSSKRVESMKQWDVLQEKFEKGETVEVKVIGIVKGGLTCNVEGLNGFMPASHVSAHFVKDLDKFKGKTMTAKIIDFSKEKRRVIVSRKEIEKVELEEKKKYVYENIHEGDLVKGTVQRLTDFGAFVDLGGVDGLIHISELSWNRVKHPSEVVKPGDVVDVYVISMDEVKNRISLGLKQTVPEPWTQFVDNTKVGDVLKGKVVNLLDFGAFVRFENGVDGLLHVSQISKEHIEKPSDILNLNQELEVKVIDINPEDRKISLSLKALDDEDEETEEENSEEEQVEKVEIESQDAEKVETEEPVEEVETEEE